MIDGYQIQYRDTPQLLTAKEAQLAVFLALYHDIGFLRREEEAHLTGAQLVRGHEDRSVAFARHYLADSPLASIASGAQLILVTNFAHSTADLLQGHRAQQSAIAKMIGSADLISQVSDRCYLERARDYLYLEFSLSGTDRTRDAAGNEVLIYRDGLDLLAKTPDFYDHLVKKRLEADFSGIYRVLEHHFGTFNPYLQSMETNLEYLRRLIAENRLTEGLRRHPNPLVPKPVGP